MSSKKPFRVVIAGGGVAGLTLANMLQKFDIDYVLLESHGDISPPVGASIGLFPNGLLILDQIGCYDAVKAVAQEGQTEKSHIRASNGKSLSTTSYMVDHLEKRHGYPMLFFDRQWLLKVLYDCVEQKDRILVNQRVKTIKTTETGVEVLTASGQTFTGDIVIGADGIHSSVRREMRRIAAATRPGYFKADEEDKVPCYYKCSFGIAKDVEGWPTGEQCFTLGRGKSFLVASGPENRCYWFLFVRFPEPLYGKDIPKYSREDEAEFMKEHGNLPITEDLTLGQVYAKRETSALTPLHEVVFDKWFLDRILLVGDSAHKPNPIGGMGGNGAIETAAELLNELLDLKAQRQAGLSNMTTAEISAMFKRVQDARFERAKFTVSTSHQMQALFAYENPLLSDFIWRVATPLSGEDNSMRMLSARIKGGIRLRHSQVEPRPHMVPYDVELPAKSFGAATQWVGRGLLGAGVGLLFNAAHSQSGRVWLSRMISQPSFNATQSLLYSLAMLISPALIYTIEGHRAGNQGSLLALPSLATFSLAAQSITRVAPAYTTLSALEVHQDPADRCLSVDVAEVLFPSLIAGYLAPSAVLLSLPSSSHNAWLGQLLPALFSTTTFVLGYINKQRRLHKGDGKTTSTSGEEHVKKRYNDSDVPYIKSTYKMAFAVQSVIHITSLVLSFRQGSYNMISGSGLLKSGAGLTSAAYLLHGLHSLWSLRSQGYISTARALKAAAGVVCGQVLVGPGAALTGLWHWREGVIASLAKKENHVSQDKKQA
ncbi:hypothetical protein PFICI_09124 [Pestalotiopsis fici W106-1]|uniref:FAD-binding domain-containing protein n=1 Tax=Pestalotiopsis fici (strain W106-1 / CGMCC3.15140) TaxID=1229662 RepID=W3X282_PESFW|nr:uncharacterized protein PFICI_09124 [Pestalotiopsis fici W106-1]ETS79271.1 hypothetical protein PFICI_09124 [Pestalotiopsis fici W106-1]